MQGFFFFPQPDSSSTNRQWGTRSKIGKNVLTRSFKWDNMRSIKVRFSFDTEDNTVTAQADVVFRRHDVGEICLEMLLRCVR